LKKEKRGREVENGSLKGKLHIVQKTTQGAKSAAGI
jgi:hypothetical protein